MTPPQLLITGILLITIALFLWGRFRHDVVALAALIAAIVAGLVPAEDAFAGFGHPAVMTVACVLVLSHALQRSGAVDAMARTVLPRGGGRTASLAALLALGAALSSVMNNVGAMALLMPLAAQLARRLEMPPGRVLMPLAFMTMLGGMTTLIGTPPNLIVSGFRTGADGTPLPFGMFDFAPAGLTVAVLGLLFLVLAGWRLVPVRKPVSTEGFETGAYMTEVRVPEGSKAVGLTLRAFEEGLDGTGAQILALVRNEVRLVAPNSWRRISAGDILVLEAEVDALSDALSTYGIRLEEEVAPRARGPTSDTAPPAAPPAVSADTTRPTDEPRKDDDIVLRELVVLPGSNIVGRSASDLHLRTRYGLNLLAVSREGIAPRSRLRTLDLRSGDLLLMQGPADALSDFASETGCVPLGPRDLSIPDRGRAVLSGAVMIGAIALVTLGLLPAAVAFALGVVATMVLRTLPLRDVYAAIDWPVVVLLAALMPVAGALQQTGAADLLAHALVDGVAAGNAVVALGVILVVTMILSDVMNNAATAAVMCPIALSIAGALQVSPDSFLMAVAIGASCAFLTPIGHQNSTLILGPGGFGFADYWRLGLPLEVLVFAVAMPVLLLVWPL